MATKIQPQQVFRLVALLPKDLQNDFAIKAYKDVTPTDLEFKPDTEKQYDHSLGLSWLTKHDIPNTDEELELQRQYVFQTMVSGAQTYNVGQFIVLFPSIVYNTRDIGDKLIILEVMDELEFPAMPDLVVPFNAAIRAAGFDEEAGIALRYALFDYISSGKVRLHEAGVRVYGGTESYKFQDRFAPEVEERLSFKELVRRQRRG